MAIQQLIEQHQYEEALGTLGEDNSPEGLFLRLTCLFHLQRFDSLCQAFEQHGKQTSTHYYENVSFYLQGLVALNRENEALHCLKEELSMPYIPAPFHDQFNDLYTKLLKQEQLKKKATTMSVETIREVLSPFSFDNPQVIFEALQASNIRLFIKEIETLLMEPRFPRRFKSILIHLLGEQQVDQTLTMVTSQGLLELNPVMVPSLSDETPLKNIMKLVEKHEKNPVVLQFVPEIISLYFLNLYPLLIDEDESEPVAMAVHGYIMQKLNIPFSWTALGNEYQCSEKEVHFYLQELNQIDS